MDPFLGTAAVAAGLVTPNALRGPRFRRVLPDVYVPADALLDLALRSRAAALHLGNRGVLVGYSDTELHGAPCAPDGAPAEVAAPAGDVRARPGLRVHRSRPWDGEATRVAGCAVTTPLRTADDLGRRADRTEAVVALDAPTLWCASRSSTTAGSTGTGAAPPGTCAGRATWCAATGTSCGCTERVGATRGTRRSACTASWSRAVRP